MTGIYALLTFGGRAFGKLSRTCLGWARRWAPADLQVREVVASSRYDMADAPDEPYYAEQYWRVIAPHLASLAPGGDALDLGCAQGRLTLRIARLFSAGRVTACDLSAAAIARARTRAEADQIRNVEFRVAPIAECVREVADRSIAAAVMTEVTFFHPGWAADVQHIVRALKPGGMLVVSFRPQYFYALAAVRRRDWDDAAVIARERQGAILGGTTVFTWQTSAEVRDLLVRQRGLEVLECRAIGACSGIPGDPHDQICRPAQLTASEQTRLMEIELAVGAAAPDAGRYLLAVARKPA